MQWSVTGQLRARPQLILIGLQAYVLLTILTLFSFKSFRDRHYEVFYWSHVVLVLLLFAACIVHHAVSDKRLRTLTVELIMCPHAASDVVAHRRCRLVGS